MNTTMKFALALALIALAALPVSAQQTLTQTTLTANVGSTSTVFPLASVTGVVAPSGPQGVRTVLYIDHSAYFVTGLSGLNVSVTRGVRGTYGGASHLNGSTVYVGPDDQYHFAGSATSPAPQLRGSCTATNQNTLPIIEVSSGRAITCTGNPGQWASIEEQYIPPTNCTFAPTTLTQTATYPQIGASNIFVLNSVTNAAAGTDTLTCTFLPKTQVTTGQGAILQDVTVLIGSQVVAPTSIGTATLGTITFGAAATAGTASTVTPVALGGTITTVSPTLLTTVTTAGAFLTVKSTPGSYVNLNTDRQIVQYTLPILQSAASAMTLNTPGLLVHYLVGTDVF